MKTICYWCITRKGRTAVKAVRENLGTQDCPICPECLQEQRDSWPSTDWRTFVISAADQVAGTMFDSHARELRALALGCSLYEGTAHRPARVRDLFHLIAGAYEVAEKHKLSVTEQFGAAYDHLEMALDQLRKAEAA